MHTYKHIKSNRLLELEGMKGYGKGIEVELNENWLFAMRQMNNNTIKMCTAIVYCSDIDILGCIYYIYAYNT